jgi:hypothetical protein
MNPMWRLIKDDLARRGGALAYTSILFIFVTVSLGLWSDPKSQEMHMTYPFVYVCLGMLLLGFRIHGDYRIIQNWRALPFRESKLALMAWTMAVLAASVYALILILLVYCRIIKATYRV